MKTLQTDLLIIGGGIHGAGIALDASGRGLSVVLCEQGDLAQATSSASSKLIHGGLRYLEQYDFRLVREALSERETLMQNALHLIHPLRFVMPHNPALRPAWLIRLGLLLYDSLGHRKRLPRSRSIRLNQHLAGMPLLPHYSKAFIYSDCTTDDARLVIHNALLAQQKGATLLTRTRFETAKRLGLIWQAELRDLKTKQTIHVTAKAIVNASGPWAADLLKQLNLASRQKLTLVKGSHIVVPKLYEGHFAYLLQHPDKRVIFVIPFQRHYSLIGTTDVNFIGDPQTVTISEEEIRYLCNEVALYFKKPVTSQDIVWRFSGVRALVDADNGRPSQISRDYHLELNAPHQTAPILSIFGGKLTTYRRLAEQAMDQLSPFFPRCKPAWTKQALLPGGDLPENSFHAFYRKLIFSYPNLSHELLYRFACNYGSRAITHLLKDVESLQDLGEHFDNQLYAKEVNYLIQHEWAETTEDILWRRTKLGIGFSEAAKQRLIDYIKTHPKSNESFCKYK